MRVALIGFGYWGKIIRQYIEASEYFKLVKIYSSRLNEDDLMTDNMEDIIQDTSIQAVFVCTPVETHFKICKNFLESGKHVFCEKPTVKNLQELRLLKEIAKRKHKILFTDYIYLVSPSINKMKDMLNEIGMVKHVEGRICQFGKFYPDADVFEVIGVHFLSIMQFLFSGCPVKDVKFTSNTEQKNCLDGHISIHYEHAFNAEIYCSLVYPKKERSLVIWGTTGILYFNMCDNVTLRY